MDKSDIVAQTIVPRHEWGAHPAHEVSPHMTLPVKNVLFSVENEWDPCTTKEECSKVVKSMQMKYQDRGLADIPYNFVVGNDGNVYEGRGWAHNTINPQILRNENYRDQTIEICVTCGQRGITPDVCDQVREAFRAAHDFMDWAVVQGQLAEDHQWQGWADEVETVEEEKLPPPKLPHWEESLKAALEIIEARKKDPHYGYDKDYLMAEEKPGFNC